MTDDCVTSSSPEPMKVIDMKKKLTPCQFVLEIALFVLYSLFATVMQSYGIDFAFLIAAMLVDVIKGIVAPENRGLGFDFHVENILLTCTPCWTTTFLKEVLGMPCTNMSMLLLFYFVCAYIKVLRRGKYDRQYKLEFRNVLLAFVVFYIGFIILMGLQPFADFSQCEALKELRTLDGVFNDFGLWLWSTAISVFCFAIPLRIARSAMEFCFSNQAFVRNRKGKVVLNHDGLEQALHTGKQKAIQGTVYGNYTKTLEGIFALCSKVIAAL